MNTTRIKKLQLRHTGPLLVSKPEHLFYFTGVLFSDPVFLLVSPNKIVLFEGVLEKVTGVKNDHLYNIGKHIRSGSELEVEGYLNLFEQRYIKKHAPDIKLVIAQDHLIEKMRQIKDASEIKMLKAVAEITAKVFIEVKKVLAKKQFTELELAHFIRMIGLKLGAESESFPTIVASGANAARPHHTPTKKVLKRGESIVLDFGFKLNGYCSDFTRTLFIKSVPKKLGLMYLAAQEAHEQALQKIRSGIMGEAADGIARSVLKRHKFDKYFIHSLGHGTGLEVHEAPGIGPGHKEILQNGMVFSIEPGVYIPGLGGIRIEDLVYLREGKPHLFYKVATALKENIIT